MVNSCHKLLMKKRKCLRFGSPVCLLVQQASHQPSTDFPSFCIIRSVDAGLTKPLRRNRFHKPTAADPGPGAVDQYRPVVSLCTTCTCVTFAVSSLLSIPDLL